MTLDAQLWDQLQAHGLTEEHLTMLLSLLQLQKNGSLAWHFVHGQVQQCDLRLVFSSRRVELGRVREAVLDGASMVREAS